MRHSCLRSVRLSTRALPPTTARSKLELQLPRPARPRPRPPRTRHANDIAHTDKMRSARERKKKRNTRVDGPTPSDSAKTATLSDSTKTATLSDSAKTATLSDSTKTATLSD